MKKDSKQAQKRRKWNNSLHFGQNYLISKYQMQITIIKAMGNHHFSESSEQFRRDGETVAASWGGSKLVNKQAYPHKTKIFHYCPQQIMLFQENVTTINKSKNNKVHYKYISHQVWRAGPNKSHNLRSPITLINIINHETLPSFYC